MSVYGIILAGGIGTRLWPRSRTTHPKQFSDITGCGRTMIQATADRLEGLIAPDHLYVVTGQAYAELCAQQLAEIPPHQILAEPSGRNTAPAIGLAAVHILQRDPDAILVSLHSDHAMTDPAAFRQALRRAVEAAAQDAIVTLGIEPTFPHTGYGYIQRGDLLDGLAPGDPPVYTVRRFLEKPDLATAQAFLEDGNYYWNGGIFVARAAVVLQEIARQVPALYTGLEKIAAAARSGDPAALADTTAAVWPALPNISIDHGVMEGAQAVATVPLNAGWNDVGSWDALQSVLALDESQNYVAQGEVLSIDSRQNIVYAGDKLIALIGVDDLVVVDTGDTLLIGHKQQMQKVKEVVERLSAQGRSDLL